MKVVARLAVLSALCAPTNAEATKDNTITKVVKILQGMLEKSKQEGEEEREIFAKFKCFCDDNEAEKKQSISDLAQEINVLTSKIQELQGSTGGLSSECAKLRSDMMANENARAEAESIRNKEHEDFVREEEDMVAGIDQMDEAISTLSEIGADQTLGSSAAHEQAMAGFEMVQKRASPKVKEALDAVTLFLNPQQTKVVNSFLQAKAPFTGSYSSQSGQIVGVLKSMRDTFRQNLAGARAAEVAAVKAFDKLMDTLAKAYTEMSNSYDNKQEGLGGNDDDLSAKKEQLAEAKAQKASDEEFLAKLLVMCEEKTKEYNERKALRANEDAAVAEAVSILNSDEAFAAFGKTDATSTGATGFLQLRSRRVRVHMHSSSPSVKAKLIDNLKNVKTVRAQKIMALVQAENPFEKVLGEIDKMLKLIEEEGKQDKENLDWCNAERTENHANLDDKVNQVDTLNEEIEELTTTIDDPETGLKAQIKQTEESHTACVNSQKSETKERTAANLLYQQDIKNLVAAEEILQKAIKALRKYYDKLEERMAGYEFIQKKEDPQAPETFGNYEGQSSQGGDAIEMLEFILEETKKEETEAHSDEENSQHNYEDSMADLKAEEADLESSLAELQKTLAAKEEELFQKKEEHKVTTADKESIEKYLAKIKPGCDFITEHFEEREENRATETSAMEECKTLIKDTPAYQNFKAEEKVEGFGDCKEPCTEDEEHVECKACLAKTSILGYCAGHSGTPGC